MVRNSEAGFKQELELKVNTLRMLEKKTVALTPEQEAELKKLPPEGRAFKKAQFLAQAEKEKADALKAKMQELEEFVRQSAISSKTAADLQEVIKEAKDNGYQLSPKNVEDAKEAGTETESNKKTNAKKRDKLIGDIVQVLGVKFTADMMLTLFKAFLLIKKQAGQTTVGRQRKMSSKFDPRRGRSAA